MNDLGLNIDELDFNLAGAPRKPLVIEEVTDLTEEDLRSLDAPRETSAPRIKKLRERHHALARLLAEGKSEQEAGIATGYSSSRISILKADPSFKELLTFYSEKSAERYYDTHAALAALSADAVEELRDRLEEAPDNFTVGQLESLAKMSLDRTGHGPSTKSEVNVKVGLADRLEAARERSAQRRLMKDITPSSEA